MVLYSHLLTGAKALSLVIPTGIVGLGALGIKYPGYEIFKKENKKPDGLDNERKNKVSKILDEFKLKSDVNEDKLVSTIFKSEETGLLTQEQKNLGISLYLLSFKVENSERSLVSIYDLINGNDTEGILLYRDLGNYSEIENLREYKIGLGSYRFLDLGFKEFELDNFLSKTINTCNLQIKEKTSNKFSKEFKGLNKGEKAKLLLHLFFKKSEICSSQKNIKLEQGRGII